MTVRINQRYVDGVKDLVYSVTEQRYDFHNILLSSCVQSLIGEAYRQISLISCVTKRPEAVSCYEVEGKTRYVNFILYTGCILSQSSLQPTNAQDKIHL